MANSNIGRWAFIIAALLAVVASFANLGTAVPWILIILGLVVGLLNVTEKETTGFLIASGVLIIAMNGVTTVFTGVTGFPGGTVLEAILDNVILIAGPAAIVVSVKHLYAAAQD